MKKLHSPSCLTHLQSDTAQAVSAELHVLVMPSIDGGFVAQGIEIDYAASGSTEEEVREHFAEGLCRTIVSYLARGRDLAGLFKSATPAEYRQAYFAAGSGPVLRFAIATAQTDARHQDVLERAPVPRVLNFIHAKRVGTCG